MGTSKDVGSYVAPKVSIRPVAQAAGVVNGVAIDRRGGQSVILHHFTGAETGAPSARTMASKIQDSDDGSTGFADVAGAVVTDITAVNDEKRASITFGPAVKKFIRVVTTVSFTGGTAPTIVIGAVLTPGGQRSLPAA